MPKKKTPKNYHCDFGGQHAGLCFNPQHAAISGLIKALNCAMEYIPMHADEQTEDEISDFKMCQAALRKAEGRP